MKTYFLTIASAALLAGGPLMAQTQANVTLNQGEGKIRALNYDPDKPYAPTKVEAKLNIRVKESTKAIRFIRDNNDPYVVTKAYVIKNADPFILKGVLKTIVSGTIKDNPVAIEPVKYVDGTNVLLIAAEEYRFKDIGNGMSIDRIVEKLDKKGLPNSTGTIDMAYFPKYNKASTLLRMMDESGIGFSGATQGCRDFAYNEFGLHYGRISYALVDEKMNAIILSALGYDMEEALNFLKSVDTPTSEIHLNYRLIEVYAENDQKIGLDFQAWKNNDGIDFFSAGGKYGTNWTSHGLTPDAGHTYSQFYNFNPKWNSKYVDFLTTCGKAKVVSSGSLLIASGGSANLTLTDGMFSIVANDIRKYTTVQEASPAKMVTKTVSDTKLDTTVDDDGDKVARKVERTTTTLNDAVEEIKELQKFTLSDLLPSVAGDGKYALRIAGIADALLNRHNVREGKTQDVEPVSGNMFTMQLSGDVHNNASNLNVSMLSSSLIGWDGQGKARLTNSIYDTTIQIDSNGTEFVIGGLTKCSVVRSVSGLPLLKDIPILGWVFSTETDTVKKSQFVLIATAEMVDPGSKLQKDVTAEINKINEKVDKSVKSPAIAPLGYQQWLLDK